MARKPRIAKAQGRSVTEWIGRDNDDRPPPHIAQRIFDRHGGVCHISGHKIVPGDEWDVEHVKALEDGGENREANMAPAWRPKHREKTAKENSQRKKADRIRRKHIGVKPPAKKKFPSRGFVKVEKRPRPRSKNVIDRRPIYLATKAGKERTDE